MKKKVVLMTVFGVIILIAVIVAALNALFTVTKVDAVFETVSEAGQEDAAALREKLNVYIGKSTTFLDLDEVSETVKEYPAFTLVSIEKDYPQTVKLTVTEREEVFAFRRENGSYAVLDENGVYLYDKAENANRIGGENVLLEGFSVSAATAGSEATGESLKELTLMCGAFKNVLGSIRANVVSVTYFSHAFKGEYFRFQMREGVMFDVYAPEVQTEEKAKAAIEAYQSLPYEQKLYGYFDVMDSAVEGGFTVGRHLDAPLD